MRTCDDQSFSEGFILVLPTLAALAAIALALYLISHVMERLPVSVAYPVWAAAEQQEWRSSAFWRSGKMSTPE